jgi:heme O synthase-like polyprenyltransferase
MPRKTGKIIQINSDETLDRVMERIFHRTVNNASIKDSRVFASAYCRKLINFLNSTNVTAA